MAHHHIFTPTGQPATYAEITLPQFALGYAVTMNQQKEHMRDLMSAHFVRLMRDANKHKWEDIQAFHGVFLTSVETGRCTWEDKDFVQELRHDMIVDKPRQPSATKQQQRYNSSATLRIPPLPPPHQAPSPAQPSRQANARRWTHTASITMYAHFASG